MSRPNINEIQKDHDGLLNADKTEYLDIDMPNDVLGLVQEIPELLDYIRKLETDIADIYSLIKMKRHPNMFFTAEEK